MLLLFVCIVVPVLFFLLVWGGVAAHRLCFPERPLPFRRGAAVVRHRAAFEGQHAPVGVREIQEEQRRFQREQARVCYHYAWGDSEGLPAGWMEDLRHRCN